MPKKTTKKSTAKKLRDMKPSKNPRGGRTPTMVEGGQKPANTWAG
jgi:hypothetical protein